MRIYLICLIAIAGLIGCATPQNQQILLVGDDRDENGCIGSAGYSWDPTTEMCVRPWEKNSN